MKVPHVTIEERAARSEARSGETFDRAIAEFSEAYDDQNERDDALVRAEQSGRIDVQRGL